MKTWCNIQGGNNKIEKNTKILEITKTTYANDLWQVGGFFSSTSGPKFNRKNAERGTNWQIVESS